MQTTNFLPGMNPYLQLRWPDTHTRLIAYISDALNAALTNDLAVIAEESISIDRDTERSSRIRADMAVVEESNVRFPASSIICDGDAT